MQAIEDIVIGSVLGPSSQRANECRIASLLAGIPETVPVFTVNRYPVQHWSCLMHCSPAWLGNILSPRLSSHSSSPLSPPSCSSIFICQHSCQVSRSPLLAKPAHIKESVQSRTIAAVGQLWGFNGRADAIWLTGNVHLDCKRWPLLPLPSEQASTPLGLPVGLNP